MKFLFVVSIITLLTSCYAEWDYPSVPRRDPCTNVVEDKVVYLMPRCPNSPIPRHPNDSTPQFVNERRY